MKKINLIYSKQRTEIILVITLITILIPACHKAPQLQIGEIITFGEYEWRVLDIQDDKALIITELVIEYLPYHDEFEGVTWVQSTLRAYLNDDFYYSATFSDIDRERIIQTRYTNEDNQWFGTSGGNFGNDKIFLLSLTEVVKYFGDSKQLSNRPGFPDDENVGNWTPAEQHSYFGVIVDEFDVQRTAIDKDGEAAFWWLRSPGYSPLAATYVLGLGCIDMRGGNVDYAGCGVRPALWMRL